MSTKTKKLTREQIAKHIGCDEVSFSKGVYTARSGYFYMHGRTAENLVIEVRNAFPTSAAIVDSGDHWAAFRGGASLRAQSHWWVKFTLNPINAEDDYYAPAGSPC